LIAIKKFILLAVLVTAAAAQSPPPPLSDSRLSVNTLLREDIFAGFLEGDMERFSRGEKNIALLLEQRPADKAVLLAWSGLAGVYRAVLAYEGKRPDEFQQLYRQALDNFAQANKLAPGNGGVLAINGGTYVVMADRLPKEYRPAAWSQAYDSYKLLWKFQGASVERLPLHLRGELLGGLAQTAHRTGRSDELAQYLDKIVAVLPDTPYEPIAKRWKANPDAAAKSTITCLSCHDSGRLAARLGSLK
jgi:tetratricopeptide (TPR) repeat protein